MNLGPKVNAEHLQILNSLYTASEVKKALFDIPGDKSPKPDGDRSHFFRTT